MPMTAALTCISKNSIQAADFDKRSDKRSDDEGVDADDCGADLHFQEFNSGREERDMKANYQSRINVGPLFCSALS
jgi:hypothetical protein